MKTKRLLMLMFASAALLLTSCKKETTYTFVDNFGGSGFTEYSILLCEYDASGSKVNTNKLDWPTTGQPYVYTANEHAEKIKVRIQAQMGSSSFNRWIQQVFYLEEGENIDITLEGSTIVGSSEP